LLLVEYSTEPWKGRLVEYRQNVQKLGGKRGRVEGEAVRGGERTGASCLAACISRRSDPGT
jgi:hypothetical protein